MSEINTARTELGDVPTKAPYYRRATSATSFWRRLIVNVISSLEYTWLAYEGAKAGITLGTLHLIRSSTDSIVDRLYSLSYYADTVTRDWKALIAYYKSLDIKPELSIPAEPKEYVSNPAGMKIEARNIRYKYDRIKGKDVLKGASFIINPGDMVAVVG
jgi:ABC-type multidrug transport system fused ATPase/permease subunit